MARKTFRSVSSYVASKGAAKAEMGNESVRRREVGGAQSTGRPTQLQASGSPHPRNTPSTHQAKAERPRQHQRPSMRASATAPSSPFPWRRVRTRSRPVSGPLIHENPHSLLIVSAGKTPPTCDEIVDLRHSACGHNKRFIGLFIVHCDGSPPRTTPAR